MIVVLTAVLRLPAAGQDSWLTTQRCLGLPVSAPDAPFPGMLVTIADDAIRAYREGVPTTYVLSFAGSNFLRGAAVSPDGRHIAVPNGVITTVTSSDVRYTVQEIRIVTTETVPRIVVRVPWRASFPVGSRFTSSGDIPRMQWLSAEQLLFVQGTLSEPQQWVVFNPFDTDMRPEPAPAQDALTRSPDGTRAVVVRNGAPALIDTASGQAIAALPNTSDVARAAWNRDSSALAIPVRAHGQITLAVFDTSSGAREDIAALRSYQSARSIRWSPDGTRLAFALFDPQSGMNRLHVADLAARELVDLCVALEIAGSEPFTSSVVWSPNGNSLAVVTAEAAPDAVLSIADLETNQRWTLLPASGELLGWYD